MMFTLPVVGLVVTTSDSESPSTSVIARTGPTAGFDRAANILRSIGGTVDEHDALESGSTRRDLRETVGDTPVACDGMAGSETIEPGWNDAGSTAFAQQAMEAAAASMAWSRGVSHSESLPAKFCACQRQRRGHRRRTGPAKRASVMGRKGPARCGLGQRFRWFVDQSFNEASNWFRSLRFSVPSPLRSSSAMKFSSPVCAPNAAVTDRRVPA